MRLKTCSVLVCILCPQFIATDGFFNVDSHLTTSLEEQGKKLLQNVLEKSTLPRYGDCWTRSLESLQDGCRMLSDAVHVDVALRFTNCFMAMSGQQEETLECLAERTDALRRLCMSQMSDRAFAVYTEFFTQTQSMCYFLQSQIWHRETERTINRLSSFSRAAGAQLELVNNMQDTLLQQQHEQHQLQAELLLIGRNLSVSLDGSRASLENLTTDLKRSTEQHSLVLEELFREFHQLHRWIVGRYAFVDGVLFYLSYLALLLIATSLRRTATARGVLLASFALSIGCECCLYKQQIVIDSISLDCFRWNVRQVSIISSLVALLYLSYTFKDFSQHALAEIREQNKQIIDYLMRLNLRPDKKVYRRDGNCLNLPNVKSDHYTYRKVKLPIVVEDVQHIPLLRRSLSRISSVMSTEEREPSISSESVESHSSRYNLRRKSVLA